MCQVLMRAWTHACKVEARLAVVAARLSVLFCCGIWLAPHWMCRRSIAILNLLSLRARVSRGCASSGCRL